MRNQRSNGRREHAMDEWRQFIADNFNLRHSPHMKFVAPAIRYAILQIRAAS